jgi:hypothetical protein
VTSWLLINPLIGASAILQEIDGLVALEAQMSSNLEALRERRAEIEFKRTIKGKIWTVVGKVFAVYCVVRIISVCHFFSPCLILIFSTLLDYTHSTTLNEIYKFCQILTCYPVYTQHPIRLELRILLARHHHPSTSPFRLALPKHSSNQPSSCFTLPTNKLVPSRMHHPQQRPCRSQTSRSTSQIL